MRIGNTVINLDRVEVITYFPARPAGAAGRAAVDDRLCLTFAGRADGPTMDLRGADARDAWRVLRALRPHGGCGRSESSAEPDVDAPPRPIYKILSLPDGAPGGGGGVSDLGALSQAAQRLAADGYRGVLAIDADGAAWGSLTIRSPGDWTIEAPGVTILGMIV